MSSHQKHAILGLGDMGLMLANILHANGKDVRYYHPKEGIAIPPHLQGCEMTLEEAIPWSEARWHCYPLGRMAELIRATKGYERRTGTIDVEIASYKRAVENAIQEVRAPEGYAIHCHPMHMPMPLENLGKEKVLFSASRYTTDPDRKIMSEHLAPLFEKFGEKVFYTTNEEHDTNTAVVQGLRMIALLGLAATLPTLYFIINKSGTARNRIPISPIDYSDGLPFDRVMFYCNAARLFSISPDTIANIILQNPTTAQLCIPFWSNLGNITTLYERQEKDTIEPLLTKARDYVGEKFMKRARQLRQLEPEYNPLQRHGYVEDPFKDVPGLSLQGIEDSVRQQIQIVSLSYLTTLATEGVDLARALWFSTPAFDFSLRMFFESVLHDPIMLPEDNALKFEYRQDGVVFVLTNLIHKLLGNTASLEEVAAEFVERINAAKASYLDKRLPAKEEGGFIKKWKSKSDEFLKTLKTPEFSLT